MNKTAINQRFIDVINFLISDKKENKGSIANILNIKPSKFSEILNGRMNAGIEEIIIISENFNINLEFILKGSGEMLREIATKSEKNIDVDMFLNLKNAFKEIFERLEKLEQNQDHLAIGHTVNSDIQKIVKQKKMLQEK